MTIFVDRKIFKQKDVQYPIIFPPNKTIFLGRKSAGKKNIETKPYNFKGLKSVSKVQSSNLYRYFYQQTASYEEAQNHLEEAKSKGFSNAFIVAFDGDKKITISEALRLLN